MASRSTSWVVLLVVLMSFSAAQAASNDDLRPLIENAALVPWSFSQPPPFELEDYDGKVRTAADYTGKVVILYMFAEW